MFFFFNQKYCSRTQAASPPTPLRMERGVITVIPLVVRRYFRSSLLDYLSKLFPTLPSPFGEGLGGEAFFPQFPFPLNIFLYICAIL